MDSGLHACLCNCDEAYSKYNDKPGTGRTGYWQIPPNNYDFFEEEEKYQIEYGRDGGIMSRECSSHYPERPRGDRRSRVWPPIHLYSRVDDTVS